MSDVKRCPCGTMRDYVQCCGQYIDAAVLPESPERLMRSRYTAFVRHNSDYLQHSWHESTRPEQLQFEPDVRWFGLQIVDCQVSKAEDKGWVEFIARFKGNGRLQSLHERSRFVREQGRWQYVDGQIHQRPEAEKIGRNVLCPCGSGKKFKRCCG